MSKDAFAMDEDIMPQALAWTISSTQFDESRYEVSFDFDPKRPLSFHTVRTLPELVALAESDSKIEIEAKALCVNREGRRAHKTLNRAQFLEAYKCGPGDFKLREGFDNFALGDSGGANSGATGNPIGTDYVPLLGGPFNKQLYIYDALAQFAQCFFAYNHDPVARAVVHITRDFTLGRGFRVDSENKDALALWRAFEEANDLQSLMDHFAVELSYNGEIMLWWLPDNATKITYRLGPGQIAPKGILPRVRLIDPSTCWEIVTYPEDITRVLYYKLVFPTQYQIYTAPGIPTSKFIIQDIPAEQVDHFKVNCASNEKRGRSDLFPVLGYLKRLRDSVNYEIIASQKASAYALDTTVEGSPADINAYIQAQEAAGTIHPAGSEFVHTSRIKREYLGAAGSSRGGENMSFSWCLNMICSGVQIPVSYLGTHLSGGSTRASALVATEPVAKKFEMRQLVLERAIRKMWKRVMDWAGIEDSECEVTFPEVIVQDRSQKIKDIKIAEDSSYISRERAATLVSKELNISDYEYDEEKQKIEEESRPPLSPTIIAPLTSPGAPGTKSGGAPGDVASKPSAVTSQDKRNINNSDRVS